MATSKEMQRFQQFIQKQANKASQEKRQELKEKWSSNAEVQRRSQMSGEERVRGATDELTRGYKEFFQQTERRECTESEARKKAESIRDKALKTNGPFEHK